MRTVNKRFLLFWLVTSALSFPPEIFSEERSVYVAAFADLSGPFSAVGEECRRGYVIADEAFGHERKEEGRSVKIVYADHARDSKVGVSEFRRLAESGRLVAAVSNAAPVVMSMNPISSALRIPLAGTVAPFNFTSENPFAFRFWPKASVEGGALARKLRSLGFTRLAVLTLEDDYPLAVSEGVVEAFRSLGGQVVLSDRILKGEADFRPIVQRVKAASPDVIFVNVIGDQISVLMRRLREQGLHQQLVGTFSLAKHEVVEASAGTAEGALFADVDGDKPEFLKRLKSKFGVHRSTGLNYACYAALGSVLQVLRNEAIQSAAQLQDALLTTTEFPLLDGPLPLLNREAQFGILFRRIIRGEVSADLSEGGE